MKKQGFFASICSFFSSLRCSSAPASSNDGLTGVERYIQNQANAKQLTSVEQYIRNQG